MLSKQHGTQGITLPTLDLPKCAYAIMDETSCLVSQPPSRAQFLLCNHMIPASFLWGRVKARYLSLETMFAISTHAANLTYNVPNKSKQIDILFSNPSHYWSTTRVMLEVPVLFIFATIHLFQLLIREVSLVVSRQLRLENRASEYCWTICFSKILVSGQAMGTGLSEGPHTNKTVHCFWYWKWDALW